VTVKEQLKVGDGQFFNHLNESAKELDLKFVDNIDSNACVKAKKYN
jgi:hypothetical protein